MHEAGKHHIQATRITVNKEIYQTTPKLFTKSAQVKQTVRYIYGNNKEAGLKHPSPDAIHAMHLGHKIDNDLKLSVSTPHFTAVINAQQLK